MLKSSMRYELKKTNRKTYYSFSYYCKNDRKNKRIPNCDVLYFYGGFPETEKEAKEALRCLQGNYPEYKPLNVHFLQKDFQKNIPLKDLVEEYATKYLPVRCVNSVDLTLFYLKNYSLHYFLSVLRKDNYLEWHEYFYDFKAWLREFAKQVKAPEKGLGISARNHCIRALNSFLSFLEEKRLLKKAIICKGFDLSRMEVKGLESVITPNEFDLIYNKLQTVNIKASELYCLLYYTGMRINEGLGISLSDIYVGDDLLEIEKYGYSCFGYIILGSQPKNYPQKNQDGVVERKPLKGKKVIGGKYTRTIPITDKLLFGIVAKNYNEQLRQFNELGGDKKNYLLFEGVSKSSLSSSTRKVSCELGIDYRSPHCLRHSFCTYFIGKTQNFLLAKQVLGHSSLGTTERYQHLSSLLVQEVAREEMGFIRV